MANSKSLLPTKEKAYFLKYLLLVTEGGRLALLDLCNYRSYPSTLVVALGKPKVQAQFKTDSKPIRKPGQIARKVLYDDQYQLLCPPSGQPDPSKFDVSLLFYLLQHLFKLKEPKQQPPIETDTTVEADVYRIRTLRNHCCHSGQSEMTEPEFNRKWQELEEILLRLGCKSGCIGLKPTIDILKVSSIDPGREQELLDEIRTWKELDEATQAAIADLTSEMKEVKTYVSGVKEDVLRETQEINTRMEDMEYSHTGLFQHVEELKMVVCYLNQELMQFMRDIQEVKEMKTDVSDVKEDVLREIKYRMEEIEYNQTSLLNQLEELMMDGCNRNQEHMQLMRNIQEVRRSILKIPQELKHFVSQISEKSRKHLASLKDVMISEIKPELEQFVSRKNVKKISETSRKHVASITKKLEEAVETKSIDKFLGKMGL